MTVSAPSESTSQVTAGKSTLIAVTVVVAIGIFLVVHDSNPGKSLQLRDIGEDIVALVVLAGVGAFGGYLSAIHKTELLKLAHLSENSKYFRRAVLQGSAGAIIIFTLAPVDPNIVDSLFVTPKEHQHPHAVIKIIALALIGGFAGGALLESSVQQFAKKFDHIDENEKTLADGQKKNAEAINLVEEALHKDHEAIILVEKALHGLDTDLQALKRAMQQSTSVTRSEIFNRADDNRRENWKTDPEAMECSLPIFKALTETDEATTCHWWYGALAYCLKDKRDPDYEEALRCLDVAIEGRRSKNIRSGAYEFNRAICKIHLSAKHPHKAWDDQIFSDLDAAKRSPKFADIIKDDSTVQNWLQQTRSDQAASPIRSKLT